MLFVLVNTNRYTPHKTSTTPMVMRNTFGTYSGIVSPKSTTTPKTRKIAESAYPIITERFRGLSVTVVRVQNVMYGSGANQQRELHAVCVGFELSATHCLA